MARNNSGKTLSRFSPKNEAAIDRKERRGKRGKTAADWAWAMALVA
jgi:hypothetical protein